MRTGRPHRRCAVLAIAIGLALPHSRLTGQAAPAGGAAAGFLERYHEIDQIAPLPGRVADVTQLVLTREAGRLTFERGKLYLLAPIGGRTVGAVFRGEGRFAFTPTLAVERAELRRFAEADSINEPINEAIMLFADSTAEQFAGLTFGPGDLPGGIVDRVHDLINSLKGDKDGSLDSDVIGPLLNGEQTGFFLARVARSRAGAVLFQVNPEMTEAVQLYRPVSRALWGAPWAVVTQFPSARRFENSDGAWRYRERVRMPHYRMEVQLTESFSANLALSAHATVALAAQEAVGPWLLFGLDPRLDIDSARWGGGEAAAVFKADDSGDLWVRATRRLQRGDSLSLTLYYHGDLIDRFANFFFIDPGAAWYPINGQGRTHAVFDLTYRSPKRYPLISIGEPRDSIIAGNVRTTRWVTHEPTQFARFNLGLFEPWHVQHPGAPPLSVYLSEEAHRQIRRSYAAAGYLFPEQRRMRENVAADISNALKLFSVLFGDPPFSHFNITEIPYGEGVSFPGMIDLSWGTFSNTSLDGFDEFFRAHEAAHQWWGNGVRPGSYRDAWLSEGLASFCGLWYLQLKRRRDEEYHRFLDQYQRDIAADQDVGPIWIGYRAASPSVRRGYDVLVYEKGAWVFHMLRVMMTDLTTLRSERFTETIRDFYQTFKGGHATTDDFQRVVERHAGAPMDWFFDQWVRGTAVPSYRVAWRSEPADGGRFRVRLRIAQERVPPTFRMPVLVAVDLGNDRTGRFRVPVNGTQTEYVSPLLPSEPRELEFNHMRSTLADVRMERW